MQGPPGDRSVEHGLQQCLDLRRSQHGQLDPAHRVPAAQRRDGRPLGLAGTDGGQQQDHTGVHQLAQQQRRGRVQQLHVVDEQHPAPPVRPGGQSPRDRGEARHRVGQVHSRGQQVRDRAERHRPRRRGGW
ncbi:hypothetical protein, partial [Streptomyces apricus]|uniref:hypothetical protein n=1 Tax=Streptomyces apricus TaxID=1828112 RepID=UPI001F37AADE